MVDKNVEKNKYEFEVFKNKVQKNLIFIRKVKIDNFTSVKFIKKMSMYKIFVHVISKLITQQK